MTEAERDSLIADMARRLESVESHLLDLLMPHRKAYVRAEAIRQANTVLSYPPMELPKREPVGIPVPPNHPGPIRMPKALKARRGK